MRKKDQKALIYVCRLSELDKTFKNKETIQFLFQYGYENINTNSAIERLKVRCNASKEFPHEIGVFLGYPLEDVTGFINNTERISDIQEYGKFTAMKKKQKKGFINIKNVPRSILAFGIMEEVCGS